MVGTPARLLRRTLTDEEAESVREYEEKAHKRRVKAFREGNLTGRSKMTFDALCAQGREYDLDPSCDEGGDAEAVWVPLDGLSIRSAFELMCIDAGLPLPKTVRRYRWSQNTLRRIATEARADGE